MRPNAIRHCFAFTAAFLSFAAAASGQEACIDGCRYPEYPGIDFTLGDGFIAKGGDITVTHMGFLRKVYNNDSSVQSIGLPTLIGALSFINPVTGEEKFLFQNQKDGVTHENDSGTVIDLGVFPKGAPIVFKYKNLTGPTDKQFDKYTGSNEIGAYNFTDPVLAAMFINGKPMPRSGGSWNWSGVDHYQWAVAGVVPGTDVKQFQFEDLDDRRFNDIVFRVSGVGLTSETLKLDAPAIAAAQDTLGNFQVTLTNPGAQSARLFYTEDGSNPAVDKGGAPQGTTKEYAAGFPVAKTETVKAIAWKADSTDKIGNATKYVASDPAVKILTVVHNKWADPAASPAGGGFVGNLDVTLSQAQGAPIHYRLCDAAAACPDPSAADPLYSTPIAVTKAQTLKAIAIKAPNSNSDVATFAYFPLFPAQSAVYLDADGDGRIESARITFAAAPGALPASVSLEDPFAPDHKRSVSGAALRFDPANPAVLIADFANDPFTAGTGFAAGPYGAFPAGGQSFPATPFTIGDGAGPIAISAEAKISLDSAGAKRLDLAFSEPLSAASGSSLAPTFKLKRGGADITAQLAIAKVEKIGDGSYEYTFSSAVFPVPGDSLQASPAAQDALGNPSGMIAWIPVTGARPTLILKLAVSGGGCKRGRTLAAPRALAIPVSVIPPGSADSSRGCAETPPETRCLDCLTGEWKSQDPSRPDAAAFPDAPEIRVTTQAPFRFDIAFFSTLGEFVNHAVGEVTEKMLAEIPADANGSKTVGLRWYPVSAQGAQAATGAYVAKGVFTLAQGPAQAILNGIPVQVQAKTEKVLVRFGYVRD